MRTCLHNACNNDEHAVTGSSHSPLAANCMTNAYMYLCARTFLCWSMCVCTCVMNVLHLTAVSILFLLMVGLILHRLPCAGAQGFVAGFVKAVLVLFTWTMPGSLPRHVNQGGDVFTPHKPYSAAIYPINTSNSLTFQLQGVALINLSHLHIDKR